MNVGIPKERLKGETRVAVIPSMIPSITKDSHEVFVESGAGAGASFSDDEYGKAGATIVKDGAELYKKSDVTVKVQPPEGDDETSLLTEGKTLISFISPVTSRKAIKALASQKVTVFAMEFIPRITRAQGMDALSSMASVAGYKAVLMAANELGKFFPLLMTAAGTILPSTVLVLGAGVAGLQAIATARRLGAKVEAFDPRPVVKEQVNSLGAQFIEMEASEDVETSGGYAKEQSDAFLKKEHEAIAARLPRVDIVITTAQIFGKKAPLLITKEMVGLMPAGSVIIDLAAEQGGNCELTSAGERVDSGGVRIIGAVNLPALLPVHASQMYSKNITNLLRHIYKKGAPDFEDEIVKSACIIKDGQIINDVVKNILAGEGR